MGGRDKTRLKCRWRQIDALVQHRMEKSIEAFGVAGHDLREVPHLCLIGEEQTKHAPDRIDSEGNARLIGPLPEEIGELAGCLCQLRKKSRLADEFQRFQPRRQSPRIAGKRARLIHRPQGRQHFQHHEHGPHQQAHHVVGKLVALSEQHAVPMDKLPYNIASTAHTKLGPDWTSAFDLARALAHRERPGMPGPKQTEERIRFWRSKLG